MDQKSIRWAIEAETDFVYHPDGAIFEAFFAPGSCRGRIIRVHTESAFTLHWTISQCGIQLKLSRCMP
eukprot:scaffold520463_cov17-Prasinocladus_malaysianus.AAC.1